MIGVRNCTVQYVLLLRGTGGSWEMAKRKAYYIHGAQASTMTESIIKYSPLELFTYFNQQPKICELLERALMKVGYVILILLLRMAP